MCKKCNLNVPVNDYTYPSPNKKIKQIKIKLNNKINLKAMQENDLKILRQKIVTNNSDVSKDNKNVSSDNITMKTQKMEKNPNPKNRTKEKLGVTALIAIMEP